MTLFESVYAVRLQDLAPEGSYKILNSENISESLFQKCYKIRLKSKLRESTLSRVVHYQNNYDTGTISAYKYGRDLKLNKKFSHDLGEELRQLHVTFFRVGGLYLDSGKEKPSSEATYFVADINNRGDLEKLLKDLGNDYDQETIIFKKKGDNPAYMEYLKDVTDYKTGKFHKKGSIEELGKITFGKVRDMKEESPGTKVRNSSFIFMEKGKKHEDYFKVDKDFNKK